MLLASWNTHNCTVVTIPAWRLNGRSRVLQFGCNSRLPLCHFRSRRAPGEEDLHELSLAEHRIQFDERAANQKQNEDPDLYGGKAMPGEVCRKVRRNPAMGSAGKKIFDELFLESAPGKRPPKIQLP